MQISENDLTFMKAMRREVIQPKLGRPKGAKDKKRRKNSQYKWTREDMSNKFNMRFRVDHKDRGILLGGDCWLWTGATTRGFGYIVYGSRQDFGNKQPRIQAHRLSWVLHFGEIPPKMLVGQTCKNKLCVHPDHLYLWRR